MREGESVTRCCCLLVFLVGGKQTRTGSSRPLGMAWTVDGSSLVTCGQTHKGSPPLVFWVQEAATGSFAKKR